MFYDNLKRLCRERGISMVTLAKEVGVSTPATSKWRAGATPNNPALRKIADYFDVSIGFLLGEEDAVVPPAASGRGALTDREIGRYEGRIEELEKRVQWYESQFSGVLSNVAELLQNKNIDMALNHVGGGDMPKTITKKTKGGLVW